MRWWALALSVLLLTSCGPTKAHNSNGAAASGSATSASTATVQIQLSWNANAGEQEGFYIEESADGTNFTKVQTVTEPGRTAMVALTVGQTATFKIQAFDQAGESSDSTSLTITAPTSPSSP